MPSRPPDRKFAREILRRLPDGFRIEYAGTNHPSVLDPDGDPVRVNGIPIQIAGSTRNGRAIENVLTRLRRAGVEVSR